MSRKALLIVDHDANATRRVRAELMAVTSQRMEGTTPADAIIRLRIHEFDSVLLCGSLSATERSELWLQISQQAVPPRVVCIGGSEASRPYSHHTVFQPIRLPSIPEPAALAKALGLQLSVTRGGSLSTDMSLRLIGKSEAVLDIRGMMERFAKTRGPVLIMGEEGTGRRLIARQIHDTSERLGAPFVSVNCESLAPASAIEKLFGITAGTDDTSEPATKGKLKQAQGGTLLLRNIASLPLDVQDALADILATKQFAADEQEPPKRLRARIVATTSRQLQKAVQQGSFSSHLFHQLEGLPINVPPLRERIEDVPLMVAHLTSAMRHRHGTDIRFSSPAMDCLLRYHWPGNQHEMMMLLQNFAALRKDRVIAIEDLPVNIRRCAAIRRLQDLPKARTPSPAAPGKALSPDHAARTPFRGILRGDQASSVRHYNLNREGNTAKIAG